MLLFFGSILLSCWPWMPLKTSSKLTPLKILCPGHVWFSIAYVSLSFNSGMYIFIVPAPSKLVESQYFLDTCWTISSSIMQLTSKLRNYLNSESHNSYMNYHISYMKFLCRSTLRWKYIYLIW